MPVFDLAAENPDFGDPSSTMTDITLGEGCGFRSSLSKQEDAILRVDESLFVDKILARLSIRIVSSSPSSCEKALGNLIIKPRSFRNFSTVIGVGRENPNIDIHPHSL
ncbi:hypothetical protein NPIL_41711 [Nephila pilipes]|uniref:Uncharacterized protein n=1 Tax=Nephila pilipes TaxID=299642 RepID=A0A8X6NKB8_NEPPI|nr:hypothetical protein NPIL_41711 [Nephila pilipes]